MNTRCGANNGRTIMCLFFTFFYQNSLITLCTNSSKWCVFEWLLIKIVRPFVSLAIFNSLHHVHISRMTWCIHSILYTWPISSRKKNSTEYNIIVSIFCFCFSCYFFWGVCVCVCAHYGVIFRLRIEFDIIYSQVFN